MLIRRESPEDEDDSVRVHAEAFATGDGTLPFAAAVVHALRSSGEAIAALSLVCEIDGGIAGHVLGSAAELDGRPSLALAPLGVAPGHQGKGVGSALVHAFLATADALDYPEVVVLGDPGYYRRFGFQMAQPFGVTPPVPEWAANLQIRTLTLWTPDRIGAFRYAEAFTIH